MLLTPALADSPQDKLFPDATRCYARSYSADHLAQHPAQRVTQLRLSPDFRIGKPLLVLKVDLSLRGTPGGPFEGYGYCETKGDDTLYCGIEGDGGGFTVTPARNGAILLTVSSLGMSFENAAGFVTLDRETGDDRSFMLRPSPCD
ncbi:MAG TPA: hypothetical protein VK146_05765 [Tabrizicola sp.]|nr:hypothetical protein [Tabrizicola sp.]